MNETPPLPRIDYDREADAVYVTVRDAAWDHMTIMDDYRSVDYAADGEPVGGELRYVSRGVDLNGLPCPELLTAMLASARIPLYA